VIVIAVSNVTITIKHNVIFNNVNGIWVARVGGSTVIAVGAAANLFVHVTNPVVTVP